MFLRERLWIESRVPIIFVCIIALFWITKDRAYAACECSGTGTCYEVADEASFDAVPWQNLSPGDTVRIHYRAVPYQRNIAIDDSGSTDDPITICGVLDAGGSRPTIQGSGTGSAGAPVIDIGGASNIHIEGLMLTNGRRGIQSDAWPGSDNTVISNNEICTNGDSTPDAGNHGGGIDIYGDHIQIVDNTIRDNFAGRAGGVFIHGTDNEIRGNLIQNNVGYHDHGGGLYVNGGSNTTVTGNIVEGNSVGPFQGGGFGGGILIAGATDIRLSEFFFNNTVVVKDYRATPAGSDWVQTRVFEISVNAATVDIRNNIFHLFAPNGHPNLALMDNWGTANLYSANWITTGWMPGHYNSWPGAGAAINNYGTLIEGLDPGFTSMGAVSGNLSLDDYTLQETSAAVDRSGTLSLEAINAGHIIDYMYRLHNSGQPRQMTGSAMDLGAFEFTAGSAAQSVLAADFAAGATSVAAGQGLQFTDLSTGSPTSWSWDFGDGSTVSNEQHPLHTYQSAGTYTVSLTVANTGGSDTETKSNYITVTSSGTSGSDNSGGGSGSGSSGGCFISSAAGFIR